MPFISWVILIMRFLMAAPAAWQMIKEILEKIREIWRLINQLPVDKREEAKARLQVILERARRNRFVSSHDADELDELLRELREIK